MKMVVVRGLHGEDGSWAHFRRKGGSLLEKVDGYMHSQCESTVTSVTLQSTLSLKRTLVLKVYDLMT